MARGKRKKQQPWPPGPNTPQGAVRRAITLARQLVRDAFGAIDLTSRALLLSQARPASPTPPGAFTPRFTTLPLRWGPRHLGGPSQGLPHSRRVGPGAGGCASVPRSGRQRHEP